MTDLQVPHMHVVTSPAQLGQIIKARRQALKLTQREVAAKLGIRQNRLSQLENNPSNLSLARLMGLMAALGLELTVEDRRPSRKAAW